MPNLIHGQNPGGTLTPIQVDENGNLSVDIVSGVSVSTSISGTMTVDQLSGSTWSTVVNSIGVSLDVKQVSGAVDSSEVSGIARQTNPSAVADAAVVKASFDDLGRQVMTPYQVRDLVRTAYLSLANGTETTLIAAAASTFHDIMQIICANTSDGVVDLDFRSSAGASGIAFSITVPADATAGFIPIIPIPQDELAQAWTVDMADFSNTTVKISALFIKNV